MIVSDVVMKMYVDAGRQLTNILQDNVVNVRLRDG